MAQRKTSFETESIKHGRLLVSAKPISRAALEGSLETLYNAGEMDVQTQNLEEIDFAKAMTEANTTALKLSDEGQVEPPFSQEQIVKLKAQNEILGIIIKNCGCAEHPAHTDVESIPPDQISIV